MSEPQTDQPTVSERMVGMTDRFYRESVATTVRRLRDTADRMEQVGLKVYSEGSADGTARYSYAASQVTHELVTGLANASLQRVAASAAQADAAEARLAAEKVLG